MQFLGPASLQVRATSKRLNKVFLTFPLQTWFIHPLDVRRVVFEDSQGEDTNELPRITKAVKWQIASIWIMKESERLYDPGVWELKIILPTF